MNATSEGICVVVVVAIVTFSSPRVRGPVSCRTSTDIGGTIFQNRRQQHDNKDQRGTERSCCSFRHYRSFCGRHSGIIQLGIRVNLQIYRGLFRYTQVSYVFCFPSLVVVYKYEPNRNAIRTGLRDWKIRGRKSVYSTRTCTVITDSKIRLSIDE